MEKYVTSPELSEKLREAGIPQKSEFYWFKYLHIPKEQRTADSDKWRLVPKDSFHLSGMRKQMSAFLIDELDEMLPKEGHIKAYKDKQNRCFCTWIDDPKYDTANFCTYIDDRMVEAKGKVLLYLKQEKYL